MSKEINKENLFWQLLGLRVYHDMISLDIFPGGKSQQTISTIDQIHTVP